MVMGASYAALTDLKTRLGIDTHDTVDDGRLTDALSSASAGIEQFCGRQFNDSGAVSQRKYRPDSIYMVYVDDFSTVTGFSITVNGAQWIPSQYDLEPLNGVYNGMAGWPYFLIRALMGNTFLPLWTGEANIVVSARWGWSAVPSPVHEACLIGAEELFRLRDMPFGIGGYGDFGIVRVRDNPFMARLLIPYQVTSVPMA